MALVRTLIPSKQLNTLTDKQIEDNYTKAIYAFNRSIPGSEQHKALRLQVKQWQLIEHNNRTERYGMLAGFNWGKQEWDSERTPKPQWI